MILGIESVYGDKRLVGKTMSLDELKNELSNYLIDDCLKVISVDGVKIK